MNVILISKLQRVNRTSGEFEFKVMTYLNGVYIKLASLASCSQLKIGEEYVVHCEVTIEGQKLKGKILSARVLHGIKRDFL